MATSISRRLQDGFIGLCGLSAVAAGMAAIDETSRRYIVEALHGDLPALPSWLRFHTLAKYVAETLPVDNPSFVAFGVVALVLVLIVFKM